MKNINKLIFHYVLEIIVTIVFVFISIPIWNAIDKSGAAKIAESYSNMDYLYMNIDKYVGNDTFEDEVAIINNTNTNREYKLLLKIEKNKKINSKENVIINNKKELLKTLKYDEDKNYNYYLIAEGYVVAAEENYNISFENSELKYNEIEYEIIEIRNA